MSILNRYPALARFLSDYGVIGALVVLCIFFTAVTVAAQHPEGESGGVQLGERLAQKYGASTRVLIVVQDTEKDGDFAKALADRLRAVDLEIVGIVEGEPSDARIALEGAETLDLVACTHVTSNWGTFRDLATAAERRGSTT